jgi:hypothetical protein
MKYQAGLLSDKLRTVLEVASQYDDEPRSADGLARLIFDAGRGEFSYAYRASDGQIRRGYITPAKIERYISFLQYLGLVTDDFRPSLEAQSLTDLEAIDNLFADTAKGILSEKGVGVQKVAEAASAILKEAAGTLPTVDDIYDHLDTDLARWRFRWLISLYSLGSTSLLRFRQSPLLLPRKYAKAG